MPTAVEDKDLQQLQILPSSNTSQSSPREHTRHWKEKTWAAPSCTGWGKRRYAGNTLVPSRQSRSRGKSEPPASPSTFRLPFFTPLFSLILSVQLRCNANTFMCCCDASPIVSAPPTRVDACLGDTQLTYRHQYRSQGSAKLRCPPRSSTGFTTSAFTILESTVRTCSAN